MQSSQCAEWSVLPIQKTFVQDRGLGGRLGPGGGAREALEEEQAGPGQRTPGLGGVDGLVGPGCGFRLPAHRPGAEGSGIRDLLEDDSGMC